MNLIEESLELVYRSARFIDEVDTLEFMLILKLRGVSGERRRAGLGVPQ